MSEAAVEAGTGRVLRAALFAPDGGDVRVPAGTTVFDAASWNGIAIDSTCGGHGTCKKCKVRVISGAVPIDSVDPRAFTIDELKAGWRLACRAIATHDLEIEVPPLQTRPKAALVGVGRHVILRPAVQKRYLGAGGAVARGSGLRPRAGAGRGRRLRAARPPRRGAHARPHVARLGLQRDRGHLRRPPDRRRAGRHERPPARDRVRPRDDHRGRDAARPRDRPARRRRLDPEPPAALRRRRDLAGVRHHARSRRPRGPPGAGGRDAQPARGGGV